MLNLIDTFLNQTTMYRLLLYYLGGLLGIAAVFSALGFLPFNPLYLLASAGFLMAVCWLFNIGMARIWNVPTNAESSVITALILALVITPDRPDVSFFFLLWAALLAMASKYILAIRGKHIFNPAAFGVAATALFLNQSATWWIGGNLPMLAFVVLGGLLVVRKIHRTDLVFAYIVATIASSVTPIIFSGGDMYSAITTTLIHTPIFFFAFVMITEPLTTPPRRLGRMAYGGLVGILSAPWVNLFGLFFTPELALLAGNIFSYLISPKFKAVVKLKEVKQLATDTYEFIFAGRLPSFKPGQYAELTLKADSSDSRGNRRYFTLASSPTEEDLRLGVKFYANPSTFKKYLSIFSVNSPILVGNIAGDFTLPRSAKKKLVFIAGGIGVTPFRSMVKYQLDKREQRDVVLFYSNKSQGEIAYKDVFDAAQAAQIGFRAVYTLTDKIVPASWTGSRGFIDRAMITKEVPDFKTRYFYISGPRSMVVAFQNTLHDMGVPRRRIKVDFFPGFA